MTSDLQSSSGGSPNQTTRLDSTVISRPIFISKYKVTVIGSIVQVREFQKPVIIGLKPQNQKRKLKKRNESYRNEEYKQRTAQRGRTTIMEMSQINFDETSKFLTLTFADTDKLDITNIDQCREKLNIFIRKLREIYQSDLKYICVPEYQDKNRRGAVHFHLQINLPYIKKDELTELWGQGFIDIKKIDNPEVAPLYISKYLNKHAYDERFRGKRKYYTSKNLKKPKNYYGNIAEQLAERVKKSFSLRYSNSYISPKNGTILFSEYVQNDPINKS